MISEGFSKIVDLGKNVVSKGLMGQDLARKGSFCKYDESETCQG